MILNHARESQKDPNHPTPNIGGLRKQWLAKLEASQEEFLTYKGEEVATIKQLSAKAGMTMTSLYTAIKRGKLEEVKIPNVGKFILLKDIRTYLDNPLGRPKTKVKELESEVA